VVQSGLVSQHVGTPAGAGRPGHRQTNFSLNR
jgi:hypothetical protein